MSEYHHPDEMSGFVVLILFIAVFAYSYFVIYDAAGNFKECDDKKYPYQLYCFDKEPTKESQ